MRAHKPTAEALEKIRELFRQAELSKNYSSRYVEIARKISMKNKAKMPAELKRMFCRHCGAYFRHGRNVRVRRNKKGIVYTCLECGKQSRRPIRQSKRHIPPQ